MLDLKHLQSQMAAFALSKNEPQDGVLDDIVEDGIPADHRLTIYRNNFRESLSGALMDIFPLCTAFVGEEFFRNALRVFVDALPPQSPVLYTYGGELAGFLRSFEPAESVPYLPDIAALEWATYSLMHLDELAIEIDEASARKAAVNGGLELSPTMKLIVSDYPVFDFWLAGTGQIAPEDITLDGDGQTILVALRNGQIQYEPLDGELGEAIRRIAAGQPLSEEGVGQIPALLDRQALICCTKEYK